MQVGVPWCSTSRGNSCHSSSFLKFSAAGFCESVHWSIKCVHRAMRRTANAVCVPVYLYEVIKESVMSILAS